MKRVARNRRALRLLAETAVLLSLATAGCGGASPAYVLETPRDGSVIRFEKSGGVAGVTESLTLREDGTGEVTFAAQGEPRDVRVSAARYEGLRARFEDAGFDELDSAAPDETAADLFSYAYGFAGTTVTDETGATIEELDGARAELERIVAAARG